MFMVNEPIKIKTMPTFGHITCCGNIHQQRTNHWPHKIKVFPEFPRTCGNKLLQVDKDTLEITPIMKKLVGL
jgi:hypothetical protein